MSKRSKGKAVGPNYSEELYRNPFAGGEDKESGSTDTYTIDSPSDTIEGVGIGLHKNYDKWWEGK